jgi:hypothetical protein
MPDDNEAENDEDEEADNEELDDEVLGMEELMENEDDARKRPKRRKPMTMMEEEDNSNDDNDEDMRPKRGAKSAQKSKKGPAHTLVAADLESLDESGYKSIIRSRNNAKMARFITRLIEDMSLEIVDIGGLHGMVPYYSGQKSKQSFSSLQGELLSTARMGDGWVVKKKGRKRAHLLLQTGVRHSKEHGRKRSHAEHPADPQLSLVSTGHGSTHKVPDLAMAVFGSRTAILLCVAGCLACFFCLDGRERRGKPVEYEDPLNISPTPPPVKEGFDGAATSKYARGK